MDGCSQVQVADFYQDIQAGVGTIVIITIVDVTGSSAKKKEKKNSRSLLTIVNMKFLTAPSSMESTTQLHPVTSSASPAMTGVYTTCWSLRNKQQHCVYEWINLTLGLGFYPTE
jgi:hypothetical protein